MTGEPSTSQSSSAFDRLGRATSNWRPSSSPKARMVGSPAAHRTRAVMMAWGGSDRDAVWTPPPPDEGDVSIAEQEKDAARAEGVTLDSVIDRLCDRHL